MAARVRTASGGEGRRLQVDGGTQCQPQASQRVPGVEAAGVIRPMLGLYLTRQWRGYVSLRVHPIQPYELPATHSDPKI